MPQHSKPAQSRDAMLAQLRQTHSRIKTVKDFSTQTKEVSAPKNYDFKQHPAYTDVRIAKAAGDTLSIRSPFFRVIEDFRSTEVKIDAARRIHAGLMRGRQMRVPNLLMSE